VTASGSTPRLRLTQLLYLLVLAAVAMSDGRLLEGHAGLLAQAAGFLLVATAVLGRLWATLFIVGRKGEQLVREGPYSCCRHPLYLCSVLASLGIGLSTRSIVLTLALPAAVGAIAWAAARGEDRLLMQSHGADWTDYRASVPAFWPAWSLYRLPERVSVPPAIYRKAFLDAASFLALWLFVLLLDTLRAGAAWPAQFHLP